MKPQTGYCHCACRDCFDTAMTDETGGPYLCSDCKEHDCDPDGNEQCNRDDAYMDETEVGAK